jgi:tripartite-type tricarboxylate transporter receptor subunit TctC
MKIARGILVGLAAALASAPAFPQDAFPSKPVRFVVAYATGGVSDIVGRVVAAKWSETLGQQVVVENRVGAGGTIGTEYVAKSAPDGYTLVLSSPTQLAIAPALRTNVPYDPLKDFTPIGGIAFTPNILTVNAALPFNTLADIVTYAKANPGKLSFGSSGPGSVGHLSGEVLRTTTGVELLHVPYKSAGAAYPDMFSGNITMVFDTLPSAIQHVKSGKARAIALMSDKRSPLLPDVPTFAEAGFPQATLRFWIGVHGPANIPPAVVQKLNESLNKALATSDLRDRFVTLGADALPITPKELDALTQQSFQEISKTVKAAGIKVE